jgi:hypothetical protein
MRALSAAAIALAMLATPGYAQMKMGPEKDPLQLQYELEQKAREQTEKDYDATMKRTRSSAPAAKVDPWSKVRPAENTGSHR